MANADFTPTIPNSQLSPNKQNYNPTGSFKFWAQKVLPAVYDDSLSYYEVLTKVVHYLNSVIQNVDSLNDSVDNTNTAFNSLQDYVNTTKNALINTYNELQSYVNDYFNNLDVQDEINEKLDTMASDGSLTELISPFIPDLVESWLNEHVTPTTPVIDDTLTISGAAADAKVTGDAIGDLRNAVVNWNGNKSAVVNGMLANGYVIADYQYGAWSGDNILHNLTNVIISNTIDYTPNDVITVHQPSGYNVRFTFLENNAVTHRTGWFTDTSKEYSYSTADSFTLEFKKNDSSDISDVYTFAGNTEAIIASKSQYTAITNWNGNKSAIVNGLMANGYVIADYQYGAWSGDNINRNLKNVIISNVIDYTPNDTIRVNQPSGYNARFTFLEDNTVTHRTGWFTDTSKEYSYSTADSFTLEFKKNDSSDISNVYAFAANTEAIIASKSQYTAITNWNGNKLPVINGMMDNGYVIADYQYGIWNVDHIENDVRNTIISNAINYTQNDTITVHQPSGYNVRFTFLKNNAVTHRTGWFTDASKEYSYHTADSFTLEFKKNDNSDISNVYAFAATTEAIIANKIKYITKTEYRDTLGQTRNLLDRNNVINALLNVSSSAMIITANSASRTFWIPCKPNTYYTVSKIATARFVVASCANQPAGGVTLLNGTQSNSATQITIKTHANAHYLATWVYYSSADTEITLDDILATLQIEESKVKTPYTNPLTVVDTVARYESLKYTDDITTVGIFDKWSTIGDSFSIGRWYTYENNTYVPHKTSRLAWGSILAREAGNTFLSLGVGGVSTRTWLSADPSTGGGLALALSSPAQDLYFLCLGTNDTSLGSSYIGSVSDIHDNDYTQNADTFYGNYGKIIQRMKAYAPNCLFIISKLVAWNDASVKDAYNTAIEGIARHFGIPCIDPFDDLFYSSNFYQNNRAHNNGHPVGMLYGGMAMAYKRLINKCIYDNPTYFMYYNGVADGT